MSPIDTLGNLFRTIIGRPKPAPPPPPPPPFGWPWVHLALDALNGRRKSLGLPALVLDPGLCRAANVLAIGVANGTMSPHDGFPSRLYQQGWVGPCSEGVSEGGRTPEECVLILDSSADPSEAHRRDFESPRWTHCGISICPVTGGEFAAIGGYVLVLEYGQKP